MNLSKLSMAAVGAILLTATISRGDPLAIGGMMPAADLKMTATDGKMTTLADIKGKAGALVIFSCNHCPFVKAWQDRMVRIANDAVKKDIGAVFVNANDPAVFAEDSLDNMKKLAADKGYAFPYLMDDTSAVARAFGASHTPEAFLFDAAGKLVYHGTIDDSTYDAAKVKKQYLSDAVNALVAGKPVATPETKSVGCGIKFRPSVVKD